MTGGTVSVSFPFLRLSFLHLGYYRQRYVTMGLLMVLGSGSLFLSHSYLVSVQQSLKQGIITRLSGNLQIYDRRARDVSLMDDPTGRAPWIADPSPLEEALKGVPGLAGVTRRILTGGLVQHGGRSMGVLIAGMELEQEAALRRRVSPRLPVETVSLGEREILVGRGVARVLQIKAGDRVPVLVPNETGLISGRRFLVRDVFSTPGLDPIAELFVYLNLTALQSILGLEREVGHLVLFLSPGSDPESAYGYVEQALDGRHLAHRLFTWEEIGRPFLGILSLSRIFLGLTNLLILLVVFLAIANATLMTLFDRTPEFGTLLALGTRPAVLFRLLWGELLLFGALTTASGLALGWIITSALGRWGIPALNPAMAMAFGQERLYFSTDARTWAVAAIISLATLLLASFWPVWRACRINLDRVLKER